MDTQTHLNFATTEWQKEIDAKAVELITAGYPPRDAQQLSARIVSQRRRKEYINKRAG